MRITAAQEYGIRCLLRVAGAPPDCSVTAAGIAQSEGLSAPYAQKLLRKLHHAGLVRARRGARGGYELGRAPSQISLAEAVEALGGAASLEGFCERHAGDRAVCAHAGACGLLPVWGALFQITERALGAITLDVIAAGAAAVEARVASALAAPRASYAHEISVGPESAAAIQTEEHA